MELAQSQEVEKCCLIVHTNEHGAQHKPLRDFCNCQCWLEIEKGHPIGGFTIEVHQKV
jgi:hypothetical protein